MELFKISSQLLFQISEKKSVLDPAFPGIHYLHEHLSRKYLHHDDKS